MVKRCNLSSNGREASSWVAPEPLTAANERRLFASYGFRIRFWAFESYDVIPITPGRSANESLDAF